MSKDLLLSPVPQGQPPDLEDVEATYTGDLPDDEKSLEKATKKLRKRAAELQEAMYAEARQSLLVILQARDAGGKDGVTRKVFRGLNPVGLRVTSFKQPSADDLAHDYLWRVHHAVPPRGTVGVFNRSHYEDVLVVRVHQLVPKSVWNRRYAQINDFERILIENDVTILKLFLHVSKDEQLRRLEERLDDPTKNWKVAEGDWKERELWPEYTRAYRDMMSECSTEAAPWYVVPADDNDVRDWLVADVLVRTLERMAPEYPRADERVIERLRKAERA